jgi:hypothetical protein
MTDPKKREPSFQLLKEGDTPFFESGEDLLGAPHGGYLPDPEHLSILDTKPIPPKRDYLRPAGAVLAVILLILAVRVIWYYSTYRVNLGTSAMERNGQTGSVVVPSPPADPNEDETLYYAGPGVTLPVLLTKYEPPSNTAGTILMVVTIDATGRPVDPKIWQGMDTEHNSLAIEAITKWRYRPATQNGKPIPVTAQLELHFKPAASTH